MKTTAKKTKKRRKNAPKRKPPTPTREQLSRPGGRSIPIANLSKVRPGETSPPRVKGTAKPFDPYEQIREEIRRTSFSLQCYNCDRGDDMESAQMAIHAQWLDLTYAPDGGSYNYLGDCPECWKANRGDACLETVRSAVLRALKRASIPMNAP